MNGDSYDVAIIGGGLAGLSLSIQLARAGYKTILFEKNRYPFHRVCGEYISNESLPFLKSIGLNTEQMNLPDIHTLIVSTPSGKTLTAPLKRGGFGISRYKLDYELSKLARQAGVEVHEGIKVKSVAFTGELFNVTTGNLSIQSTITVGAFGKRSNMDISLQRDFTTNKPGKLNNFVAVKYHVQYPWQRNTIALHNFENGYCGISAIEDYKCCLCYLTTAENLRRSNNSIEEMEHRVLGRNPHLHDIFSNAKKLYAAPETISQVTFERKTLIEDHILMAGDAAGMITPLCGYGMSMAFHSSLLLFQSIAIFLQGRCTREQMEKRYAVAWNKQFSRRLSTGRVIQGMFGKPILTELFVSALKPFPLFTQNLIKATHGQPF
jgi:menaquinone-9 beta-reductase